MTTKAEARRKRESPAPPSRGVRCGHAVLLYWGAAAAALASERTFLGFDPVARFGVIEHVLQRREDGAEGIRVPDVDIDSGVHLRELAL
jgi:hypothetical protein